MNWHWIIIGIWTLSIPIAIASAPDSSDLAAPSKDSPGSAVATTKEPKEQASGKAERVEDGGLANALDLINQLLNKPSTASPTLYKRSDAINKALDILQSSQDPNAQVLIAECLTFGHFDMARNLDKAFKLFQHVATEHGNARAHFMLGFFYSTAILPAVERDPALTLLHYSMAALGNDIYALVSLGYRFSRGLGVDSKCESSLHYYKRAALHESRAFEGGVRSGVKPTPLKISIAEEAGGLYGPGASHPDLMAGDDISVEDLVQYHQHNADRGDAHSQVILGQLYYFGRHTLTKSYEKAMLYYRRAASILPPSPPQRASSALHLDGQMKAAAQAVSFLGNMYWHGHGVPQDNTTAARFFKQAAEYGNADALNNLGVMYWNGIVVKKNANKAFKYFSKAVESKNSEAMVNLARIYLNMVSPDFEIAVRYLDDAMKMGSVISLYELGKLHLGTGPVMYSCQTAKMYFKTFVERADYDRPILEDAYRDFENGKYENAYMKYLLASELGYDIAHVNAAYMLETGKYQTSADRNETMNDALAYYQRAANLGNVEARLRVGDMYYAGLGAMKDEKFALALYQAAADEGNSPIGWFNLGYMYQEGIGVKQDFHLAKRYFDRALTANPAAYLPVSLAQIYLRVRYFYHWLIHGGSFYLDSAPAELDWQNVRKKSGENDLDSDDSLLAEIKRAQEERIGHDTKREENNGGDDEGGWEQMEEWDEWPKDNDSDLSIVVMLMLAAAAVMWARNQQPVPPPAARPLPAQPQVQPEAPRPAPENPQPQQRRDIDEHADNEND